MKDTYQIDEAGPELLKQIERIENLIETANSMGKGDVATNLHGLLGPLQYCLTLMDVVYDLDRRMQIQEARTSG